MSTQTPPPLSPRYARVLTLSKQQLADIETTARDSGRSMIQPGGAVLSEHFDLPAVDGTFAELTEPLIETFVVDGADRCDPTGSDERLISTFREPAAALARLAGAGLTEFGVTMAWPAYVTASVTPIDQVPNTAHFDDELFTPGEGVGVVVTVADQRGTRLAATPVPLEEPTRARPWSIDPMVLEDFEAGRMDLQEAGANQVMVMARFGQLHAGPVFEPASGTGPLRALLVLRADTVVG